MVPSLNVGQDNCGCRLGQQPQSVPNLTQRKQRESLRIAWLRALRCGQNAYADEHDRTDYDPLRLHVQQISGDRNAYDKNEIAD
jgi:hypothetical protein